MIKICEFIASSTLLAYLMCTQQTLLEHITTLQFIGLFLFVEIFAIRIKVDNATDQSKTQQHTQSYEHFIRDNDN